MYFETVILPSTDCVKTVHPDRLFSTLEFETSAKKKRNNSFPLV